jgi:hypothetical protein
MDWPFGAVCADSVMLILRSGSSVTSATTVFRRSPEERRDLAIFSVMMVRPAGFVVGLLGALDSVKPRGVFHVNSLV